MCSLIGYVSVFLLNYSNVFSVWFIQTILRVDWSVQVWKKNAETSGENLMIGGGAWENSGYLEKLRYLEIWVIPKYPAVYETISIRDYNPLQFQQYPADNCSANCSISISIGKIQDAR